MVTIKRSVLAAAAALLLFTAALALADPQPVAWTVRLTPPDMRAGEGGQLVVRAAIQPGWHIYALDDTGPKPTTIELKDGGPLTAVGDPVEPPVSPVRDPVLGKDLLEYRDSVSFGLGVALADGAKGRQKATVKISWQACNSNTCLLPASVEIPVEFTPAAGAARDDRRDAVGTVPEQDNPQLSPAVASASGPPPTGGLNRARERGLLLFMLYCFGGGLLSLLTPCVFPMIPLTVNFFTKRQASSRKAGVRDALAYCVGIIGTFTGVGLFTTIAFGAGGLQRLATNPILNLAFAALFIALAANLMGFFEISMPQFLQQRAQAGARHEGLIGPVLMGVAATISSFTCTGAIVGTLLATAATGDRLYPILGMLAFSTAFAMPFFLLALFPQYLSRLPRSGSWMVAVKAYMGFIELVAAVKFLSNADLVWSTGILTRPVFLGAWALILLAAALYLFGLLPLKGHDRGRIGPARRVIGAVTAVLAVWCFAGARGASLGSVEAFLPPEKSTWLESFTQAQAEAQHANRPIFINFTGVTCTNCRFMEKTMFTRQDVKERLKSYVLVELYTDRTGAHRANDEGNQRLENQLVKTLSLPVYVIVSPQGHVISSFAGSTSDPKEFLAFLNSGTQRSVASR